MNRFIHHTKTRADTTIVDVKYREEIFAEIAKIRIRNDDVQWLLKSYDGDDGDALEDVDKLALVLQDYYARVTNGFLSEVYELLYGAEYEFKGEVRDDYKCPCCGYKTLDEVYNSVLGTGYSICLVCRWEDDGTKDINQRSGPNKGSIADYRSKMSANKNYYYREKYSK